MYFYAHEYFSIGKMYKERSLDSRFRLFDNYFAFKYFYFFNQLDMLYGFIE